jgi:cytoskeleton protein RodZ
MRPIVGLDRTEIGEQLREEMGGQRFATSTAEVFEPADPARTMPKWLVFGAIAAVILLSLVMSWLNQPLARPARRTVAEAPAAAPSAAPQRPPPPQLPPPPAQGPVVLTATAPAWIQVTDQGKTLFAGELAPGQTYAVPPTATAPLLRPASPKRCE